MSTGISTRLFLDAPLWEGRAEGCAALWPTGWHQQSSYVRVLGPMELRSVALVALQTGMAPPAASGALEEVTRGQSGHPSGDVPPLCRLVQRVPAGVGQLHLPGDPQHAHDVHRVVDL